MKRASLVGVVVAAFFLSPARAEKEDAQVASIDARLAELERTETSARRELDGITASLAENEQRTRADGRAYYRLTKAGLLPLGGGFEELVRHAMRLERTRRALAATLTRERLLRGRSVELAVTLERVASDRNALTGQRLAIASARATADEQDQRQDAFDRAFRTSSPPSNDYVAIYGGIAAHGTQDGPVGFSSAKGRLLFPVAGRAEVRSARRDGASGAGLEVRATQGTPVRSVFAGRVAFADRYGAYGRIVILDHGDHYYTVSGNLGAVDVKVGDELTAGERIGTVGDEGGGTMLYFEVRHGTDTLAPRPWLGL